MHGTVTQNYPAPSDALLTGLTLARAHHHRLVEASILTPLGTAYRDTGDFDQAAYYFQQNLQLSRQVDKRRAIALVTASLGTLGLLLGNLAPAIAYLAKAQQIFTEQTVLLAQDAPQAGEISQRV